MNYPVLPMHPQLWPVVREIYGEGIATGNATFETELPEWETWDSSHRKDCRLVALEPFAEDDEELVIGLDKVIVLGWAALSPVSARRVYAGVAKSRKSRSMSRPRPAGVASAKRYCGPWCRNRR